MPKTFAVTKGGSGAASDLLSTLVSSTIAVTGTVTATISRMHLCTGTSADYTVTLPTAVGNTDKLIGFLFGPTLTQLSKLVTLDGNASETMNGVLTKVLWAGEACVLKSDGSNWNVVDYKANPMSCLITKAADQTGIAQNVETKINLDTATFDNTGLMADTTNKKVLCKRAGRYRAETLGRWNALAVCARALTELYLNGAVFSVGECSASGATGNYSAQTASRDVTLAVADYFELYMFHGNVSNQTALCGTPAGCYVSVTEIPAW